MISIVPHLKIGAVIFFLLLTSAELSFADSTTWVQVANMEATARHRCSAFSVGHKGYIGLGHYNSVVNIDFEDFWEYDPATDTWTQKADFGPGKRYHCFEFVIGNKAYVGAGRDAIGVQYNDTWKFNPATNVWRQVANFPGSPRQGSKGFVIDSIAYIGSGIALGAADDNDFYSYNALTDTWTSIAPFPGLKRNCAVTFSIEKVGYFGTGRGDIKEGNDFWKYTPLTDTWTQVADASPISRGAAIGFAINGYGYVMTGIDSSMHFNDVWEYDPVADTFQQISDFPGTKRHFMVAFVIHQKAYCGSGTSGINFNDLWVFDARFKNKSAHKKNYDPNVSPNQAIDTVSIQLATKYKKSTTVLTLKILDLNLNLVGEEIFGGTSITFERDNLQSGIYFYQIYDKNKMIQYGRFVFV
jgi:N-acetylneuraminic acid mutarotase